MSLKYRDNQGTETPVAGLNGTSGELVPSVALYQKGSAAFTSAIASGGASTLAITFQTPMPDTDYIVSLSGWNQDIIYEVVFKTTTGFSIVAYNKNAAAQTPTGTWQAFKLMTDEVHEADASAIAQNTANFATTFSETTSYAVGDYCTYNGILYRCTTAHTAGVWVAGHFTQVTVGGDIASINSKIPSTASSTEKLAYVEYNPSTSLYSTWAELLELIHQHGAGYWTGTIYLGKWYTYTARIVLGGSGYWYGSFLAKCAETEDLVGASKTYGGTNTWVVSHYMPDTLTVHSVTKVSSNISLTNLYTDCCSKNGICDVGISFKVTDRLGDGEKMFSGLPKAGWLTRFAIVGYGSGDATPNVYANAGVNSDGEIEARGVVPTGDYYLHTCYVIRT